MSPYDLSLTKQLLETSILVKFGAGFDAAHIPSRNKSCFHSLLSAVDSIPNDCKPLGSSENSNNASIASSGQSAEPLAGNVGSADTSVVQDSRARQRVEERNGCISEVQIGSDKESEHCDQPSDSFDEHIIPSGSGAVKPVAPVVSQHGDGTTFSTAAHLAAEITYYQKLEKKYERRMRRARRMARNHCLQLQALLSTYADH